MTKCWNKLFLISPAAGSPSRWAFRKIGATIAVSDLLIEDAWAYFETGDTEQYQESIATALIANWKSVDVVLAQASMASAAERCSGITIPILSSPQLGVQAALAACREALFG